MGAEHMKKVQTWSTIPWLLLVIFLGSVSVSQSQDLVRQVDQLKEDLVDLRNEVNALKTLVYGLRKAMLESAPVPPAQQMTEKTPPKKQTVAKAEPAADEKELTRVICKAVGKFFVEADASLRQSNSTAARDSMNRALLNLTSALEGYSGTHRVSKLLSIYEGLAWDTYVAVALRQSIQGNEEFIASLNAHRRKYNDTCPRE
jgi:hypothetical protein